MFPRAVGEFLHFKSLTIYINSLEASIGSRTVHLRSLHRFFFNFSRSQALLLKHTMDRLKQLVCLLCALFCRTRSNEPIKKYVMLSLKKFVLWKQNLLLLLLLYRDFELAIINAVSTVIRADKLAAVFFYLRQSMFREIQSKSLMTKYSNQNDSSVKVEIQSLRALAFVPPEQVQVHFEELISSLPAALLSINTYFSTTYVSGRVIQQRDKRQARQNPSLYRPVIGTQYQAVSQSHARMDYLSERWHNKF